MQSEGVELGQKQAADFGCNLGVTAGEHERSLLSAPRLRGGNGGGGGGGRRGINVLAPPSSVGIGEMPRESEGWAILFGTLGARLGEDPYVRTPKPEPEQRLGRHSGGSQQRG